MFMILQREITHRGLLQGLLLRTCQAEKDIFTEVD
jgi:hypothetical protein